MNSNKFSRVIALLLSLVMLLGTLPTSYAEGSPIIENAKYEAALDAVVQMYRDELAACTTYEEAKVLYGNRDWNHFEEFFNRLPEAERNALDTDLYALYEDYVVRTNVIWPIPAVDFTGVAGFMPPVTGSTYDLRNRSIMLVDEDGTENPDSDGNGVVLKKYISSADTTNGTYTLTLEAYTTGAKTLTETEVEKPVDIILVLDQSGSMEYCINCGATSFTAGEPCDEDSFKYTAVYDPDPDGEYYYRGWDGGYSLAHYCEGYDSTYNSYDCDEGWYTEEHYGTPFNNYHHGGYPLTPKTSQTDYNNNHTQFYTRESTENSTVHQSRRDALKDVVGDFVASVAAKAAGPDRNISTTADNINHRVAVVGFATSGENNTELLSISGNNNTTVSNRKVGITYSTNLTNQNYKDVLQSMDTAAGKQMVEDAIEVLGQSGATRSDVGMTMATNILKNNRPATGEQRSQIVIMFTDGTPTTSREFSKTVAEEAISQALTQKSTYGATVYTIGVFDGADASNPTVLPPYNTTGSNRENRYMHLVSSNYLEASGIDDNETGKINSKVSNSKSYYLSASNTAALSTIFEKIAGDVEEAGGSSTTLTEETVVKDIVASEFTLPNGADSSDIKVYTSDYVAANTFGTKNADGTINEGAREAFNAQITINGSTISVSNFNFSENWVGEEVTTDVSGNTSTVYHGQKLIIEVPIKVREDFLGGNQVETNGKVSGIFENKDATEKIEEFVSPTVNLPLKEITPVINDQHVYISNYADLLQMISHYSDQTQYHRYQIGNNTYTIDGVNNSHVNITYTFKDGTNTIATYTIPAGQTTGTFSVTGENQVLLTDSTQYSISCTVSPSTKVEGGYNDPVTSGNVTGTVHVYKPVLTFKDTAEKYLSTGHSTDYYNVNNYQGVTSWKRADGTLSTAVTMRGDEPSVDLTYEKAVEGVLLTGMQVTAKQDVPVNVTKVELDGDVDGDYTTHASSIRKDCDCGQYSCEHTNETPAASMGNNPEFIVHVYDVYGHLKFSKVVSDNDTSDNKAPAADQVFTFTVTLTDKNGKPLTDEFDYTGSKEGKIKHDGTITLTAGQNVTINNLPPETKYTVTEAALIGFTSAMSVVQDYELTSQIDAGKTDELLFTNTYKVGDLKITKKIVDKNGNIVTDSNVTNDVFTFTATIGGVPQTVTITGANSTTIADIPYGTSYSVTETKLPTGYKIDDVSIVDNGTGAIVEGVSEVVVTNTYETGALKIEKVVVGSAAPKDDTFVFTVELPDGKYSMGNETLTVSGGKATVSLEGGESVTITGIPAGANYAVSEKANANYTTTMSGNTGTIEAGETQKAVFTNTYLYQYLDIKKTVTDATDTYAPTTFNFTITKDDGASYTAQITAAEVGKEYIATVLVPTGNYTVTETANAAFATEYQVGPDKTQNITVPTGNAVSISVTNTRIMQDISVNKVWDDNNNALGLRPENITATLNATANGAAFTHGQSALTVAGDAWTAEWTNVPTHDLSGNEIAYSVTENAVEHYNAPDYSGDATDGFVITNAIAVGALAITKNVVNDTGVDQNLATEFIFEVELGVPNGDYIYKLNGDGQDHTLTITDGKGQITLTDGQTATILKLPLNTTYTVTETVPTGYVAEITTEDNGTAGVIDAGMTDNVTVENTFDVADLTVTKVIEGNVENDNTADDVFTFEVALPQGDYAIVGVQDITTLSVDATGKAQFSIVGENSVTIRNIPINTEYTVEEVENLLPDGYEYQSTVDIDSGVLSADGATVTVTNVYTTGELTISKTVVGTDAPTGDNADSFEFTVSLPNGTYSLTKGGVTSELTVSNGTDGANGTATISLKNGESVSISGVPMGAAYTVKETVHDDYTTAVSLNGADAAAEAENGTSGDIDADGELVAYTNTYQYASLTINKQFNGNDVDPDAVAMFEVTDGNGNLVATVAIKGNGSVTINHLNVGEKYTVEELTDWNWRYVVTPSDGKTSIDELDLDSTNNVVRFTNEKNKNQWLDDEVYVENHFTGVSPTTTD